jgi:hypothetical protein
MAAIGQRWGMAPAFLRRLFVLLIVNLCLRICWIAATAAVPLEGPTDQWTYVGLGTKVAYLRRWTAFGSPPLYPFFLGALIRGQRLVGLDAVPLRWSVGLVQAFLGTGVVAMASLLTFRLAAGRIGTLAAQRAAVVTAGGLAVWPNQVMSSSVLLTERLATPLFVLLVAVLLWNARPTRRSLVVAGLLLAAVVLTRPTYGFALVVILPLVWTRSLRGSKAADIGALALAAVLPMSVWWGYTAWQAGGVLPLGSTTGAFNLCMGNQDDSTGYWSDRVIDVSCPMPRSGHFAATDNAELQATALRWMAANLDDQPRLVGLRAGWTFRADYDSLDWLPDWRHYRGPGSVESWRRLCEIWYRATLWFLLPGLLALAWRLRRAAAWVIGLAVSTLIGPLLSVGDPRYHEVLLVMAWIGIGYLGGVAWDRWSSMVHRRRAHAIVSHA